VLIFPDLGDFKKINDSLGYIVGDELLCEVATWLQGRVREEDTLVRRLYLYRFGVTPDVTS
jgi:diguanylate cyclase (GGDEF)-like protein